MSTTGSTPSTTARRLLGKRALVTGSSTGIGRGIALHFAREGADVVINYHGGSGDPAAVVKEAESHGVRATAVAADVSRVSEVRDLIARGVSTFGGLDILVNNAGIEKRAPFWEVTEADYDAVLGVNLKGPFFAAQAFASHCMQARHQGRIINISSVHEDMAFPNFSPYCASKGGLRMLTRTLAVELGPHGITVNGIAPGAIATPINSELLHDPSKLKPLLRHIPAGRLGTPDDVAELAVYLASDAASYVTGSTYVIDGGLMVYYSEQ